MSDPLPPSSHYQVRQLFTDPAFAGWKNDFVRAVITNLKFRHAPQAARRLRQETERLAQQGLTDQVIYARLHELVHQVLYKTHEVREAQRREKFSRGENRADQVLDFLGPYLTKTKVGSYLDVGCSEGSITAAMGKLLRAEKIQGCDVVPLKADQKRGFEFTLLDPADPYRLPYPTASQDVVSAFMSFHHIECLDRTLAEIHRVLRPSGILIVREHDARPGMSLFLDVLHGFYAMVWSEPPEMPDFSTHFSHYRGQNELLALIQKPVKKHLFDLVYVDEPRGQWRYFYAVFTRPGNELVAGMFPPGLAQQLVLPNVEETPCSPAKRRSAPPAEAKPARTSRAVSPPPKTTGISREKLAASVGRQGYTVDELKEFCRAAGLKISGTKAELVARLAG